MAHLYASFADASLAEKAAGALLDFGVRQEDITLVAHDEYGKTRASYGTTTAGVGVYDAPAVPGDLNPLDQGGPDSMAHGDTDVAAKHGISTTTPEDAGQGAVEGAGIGIGVGILASLAALAVPGVGLVLGGGLLASALGATALTAGAGAVAGGVTGYLKEQGVPGHAADSYHGAVEQGGAMLSINVPSGNVDAATAEQVIAKYGASNVNSY